MLIGFKEILSLLLDIQTISCGLKDKCYIQV